MAANDPGFDPALGSLPEPTIPPPQAPPPPFPSQPTHSTTPPPRPAPAGVEQADPTAGCQVCGSLPAERFEFAHITGMLFRWSKTENKGVFCGSCAQSLGRQAQNRTLLTGWFGFIAFVMNLITVGLNTAGLLRAGRLDSAPAVHTLDPGRPVFLRVGIIGGLAVAAGVAAVTYGIATDSTVQLDDLDVAACLEDPGIGELASVESVSCDLPHAFEVFDIDDLDIEAFPGDRAVAFAVDELCAEAFEPYVGAPLGQSEYGFTAIVPTAESWSDGDRSYICLLGSFSGNTTGSAQGSGR